jgi:hypothetical protein
MIRYKTGLLKRRALPCGFRVQQIASGFHLGLTPLNQPLQTFVVFLDLRPILSRQVDSRLLKSRCHIDLRYQAMAQLSVSEVLHYRPFAKAKINALPQEIWTMPDQEKVEAVSAARGYGLGL